MEIIEWSDDFSLNDSLMDEQHKKIFALIKKASLLVEAMQNGVTREHKIALKSALLELINYVNVHFKSEEEHLKHKHFPLMKEHTKCHRDLEKETKELLKYSNDPLNLAKELLRLAKVIAYDHILGEDLLAVSFLKKAVELNEIHQSLEIYTKIKISKGFSGEKTFTYICACPLKETQIIESIHNELQDNFMMRCPVCKCPYVYLGDKDELLTIKNLKNMLLSNEQKEDSK